MDSPVLPHLWATCGSCLNPVTAFVSPKKKVGSESFQGEQCKPQVCMDSNTNSKHMTEQIERDYTGRANNGQYTRAIVGNATPTTVANASYENISATSAFNLTDRLPIFSYLVNSNRIRWYRVIMHTFLLLER